MQVNAATHAAAIQPGAARAVPDKVKTAAQEFEAVLIGQMLEPMWAGLDTKGPFGGGTGETIFRSLMIQEIGRQMSDQGGMGLAANV
ncbi:MAG TPA: chemotactic signal-response protein chel, partial [Alphaproteobacteria bacterium]|nr:chemotactic signal-response protein chel [Alphaproteobacteria bacterium]